MGKLNIKGGTPIGGDTLCRTCSESLVLSGFRESERVVLCDALYNSVAVPFAVHECSRYHDRNRPSYDQMEKLAINVVPGPLKPVGFKTGLVPPARVVIGAVEDDSDDE